MALTIEELLAREDEPARGEAPTPREGDLPIEEVQAREAAPLPTLNEDVSSEFSKGAAMARQGLQHGFGGFVSLLGHEMGWQGLEQAGYDISNDAEFDMANSVAPRIHKFEEIKDFDDFADFVAQGVGQLVPSMTMMIGTGGVSGLIGRQVLKQGIKHTIRNQVTRELAGKGTKKEIRDAVSAALKDPKAIERLKQGTKAASLGGAGVASGAPQAGDIFQDLVSAGVSKDDASLTAMAGGTLGGALDTVLLGRVIGRYFPGVNREFAKRYTAEFAKEAGMQLALEGGTESAQEVIALAARAFHDPSFDITSDEAKSRVLNAFVLGALGGTLSGGATGVGSKFMQVSRERRAKAYQRIADSLNRTAEDTEAADNFKADMDKEVEGEDADTVFPTATELKDSVVNVVTQASQQAKKRAVRILREAGVMNSSVGAAHVPMTRRALNEMDMIFYERITPRVRELIAEAKARVTELRNDLQDPTEIRNRVEEIRMFFEDAVQQLVYEELPAELAASEERAVSRMAALLQETEDTFTNYEPIEDAILALDEEAETVDVDPDTVMSRAFEEASVAREDFVDDENTTPQEVQEEELAAGNSRRLQEEKRGERETILGRRVPRRKTVLRKDGTTKTFETERRSRREIRADEETARPRTVQDDLVAFDTEEEARAEMTNLERLYDVAAMLISGDPNTTNEQVEFSLNQEEDGKYSIRMRETGLMDRSAIVWDAEAGESVPNTQYMAEALDRAREDARGNPMDQIEIDGVKYRVSTLAEAEVAILKAEEGDSVNIIRAAQNLLTKIWALGAGETLDLNTRIVWSGERRTIGEVMGYDLTRSEKESAAKRRQRLEAKAKKDNVRQGARKETRANPPAADQTNEIYNERLQRLQEELKKSEEQHLSPQQKAEMRKRGMSAREIQEAEEARVRPGQQIQRNPDDIRADIEKLQRDLQNHEANRQAREELDPFIQGHGDPVAGSVPRIHGSDGKVYGPDDGDPPTFDSIEAAEKEVLKLAAAGGGKSSFEILETSEVPSVRWREAQMPVIRRRETTEDIEVNTPGERGEAASFKTARFETDSYWTLEPILQSEPTGQYIIVETPYPSRSHADPVFDTPSFETQNIDDPSNAGPDAQLDEEADQLRRSTLSMRTGLTKDDRKGPSTPAFANQVPVTEGGSAPTPNAKQAILDEKHRRGSVYGDEEFEQVIDVNDTTGTVIVERGGPIQDGNVRVLFNSARRKGAEIVARLVADLANRLGMRNGINVVDRAGLDKIIAKAQKNKGRNDQLIRQLAELRKSGKPAAAVFHNSQIILYVDDRFAIEGAPKGAAQLAGFMHEMGHAVFQVYFHRLSVEAKAALWNGFVAANPEFDVHANPANYRRALDENEGIRRRFAAWRKRNNRSMTNKPAVLTRQYREWLREEGYQSRSFEEWAANQFVSWVTSQTGHPNTRSSGDPNVDQAVRGFYRRIKTKMVDMFNWFKEKFGADETGAFDDFMQGIIKAHEGKYDFNVFSRSFKNDKGGDYMGYQWFGELPKVRNYTEPTSADGRRMRHKQAYDGMIKRMESLSRAIRSGNLRRIWNESVKAWEESMVTLNGRVRRMADRYPALNELAAAMRPRPGEEGTGFTLMKFVNLRRWETQLDDILAQFTPEQIAQAREELHKGTSPTTDAGKALQKYLNEFARYLKGAGLPIQEVENYFPRVLDRQAVLADGAAEILIERYKRIVGVDEEYARKMVGRIIAESNEASRQGMAQDSVDGAAAALDVANPYAGNFRQRKLTRDQYDQLFDGYMETDVNAIFLQYLPQMVRMAEYNRLLGERSTNKKEWNPNARLEQIIAAARDQGMTDDEVAEIEDIVDTWMGRRGIAMHPRSRAMASWLMTFQNMRVLLFTVFASFPDLFTVAVRSGSFKTAVKGWRDYITQESLSREDIFAMGRTWGIISDHLNRSAIADHVTANFMTEGAQKANDAFFRATGLLMYTNFTRKLAISVGNQFISEHAVLAGRGNVESQAKLAELGLSWDTTDADGNTIKGDVTRWIENNRRAYGSIGYSFEANPDLDPQSEEYKNLLAAQKVRDAMFRFVDESVMRPDSTQRPGWASDPRWMLVFHLKSFMYSFQETTLKRVIFEMKQRQGMSKAVPLLHLSLILPATALGLELREVFQYMGSGSWGTPNRTPRTDRMTGFEYMTELVTRSGMLGASQLALDLEAADDRNQFPLLGVVGPTATSAKEFLFDPWSQAVPKHIPVVSQLPWARDLVRQVVFE